MTDFLSTFLAVFLAVTLGEIAKEAYIRWLKDHVSSGFDKLEEHKERIKDNMRFR